MSRWLDRLKHQLDLVADDGELLTPLERSLLLTAAALCDRLETLETALGFVAVCDECSTSFADLIEGVSENPPKSGGKSATDTASARQLFFHQACQLRRLFTPQQPHGAGEVISLDEYKSREVAA
jgi:hypothetical protein